MNKKRLKSISVMVPDHIIASIDEIAESSNRNRSEIVRESLRFYIDRIADYRIAVARLNDPSDVIQGEKEFLAQLDSGV